MQLDHINGVNDDNRLENLRLLCPNCHSQTETFAGKNKKLNNKTKTVVSNTRQLPKQLTSSQKEILELTNREEELLKWNKIK